MTIHGTDLIFMNPTDCMVIIFEKAEDFHPAFTGEAADARRPLFSRWSVR